MEAIELVVLRLKAGLKQYELAQLLGVPATIVCDMERGRRPITPEWERRIREVISKRQKGVANQRLVTKAKENAQQIRGKQES